MYELFEHFNIDARTQDDEHYKATSFKNIRHALNRHFNGVPHNQKLDIIKDTEFSVLFIRCVIQWEKVLRNAAVLALPPSENSSLLALPPPATVKKSISIVLIMQE